MAWSSLLYKFNDAEGLIFAEYKRELAETCNSLKLSESIITFQSQINRTEEVIEVSKVKTMNTLGHFINKVKK